MTFNKVYNTQDVINLINKSFGKYMIENANTWTTYNPKYAIDLYDCILHEFLNAEKGSED